MRAAPRAVQDSQPNILAKFSAAQRLLREDGFGHVVQSENIADKYYKIFFSRNEGISARLGIIASKKVLPGAVDRNKAKRVIREAFRQHSIKSRKLDLVVMVRRAYAQEPHKRGNNLETLFSGVENRCAEL